MTDNFPIDWNELRKRLERSRASIESALVPNAERAQAVYRMRAERLARKETLPAAGAAPFLVFQVGNGRYGIELSQLAEVIAQPSCARVPGAPPQVAGVIQVRGEIRPVWELSAILGLSENGQAGGPSHVLLVRRGSREDGLRVGAVAGIRSEAPGETGQTAQDHCVKWVTSDLVAILDVEELLKEENR